MTTTTGPRQAGSAYVIVSPDDLAPAGEIVAGLGDLLDPHEPIQLCRSLPAGVSTGDLPVGFADSAGGGAPRSAAWAAPVARLRDLLDRGLALKLGPALVVRVGWPPSAEDELALLDARLAVPSLRLAVALDPDEGETIFQYFDRLGFAWSALPPMRKAPGAWAAALGTLAASWCLDPRTTTAMEPVRTGFGRLVAERLACPRVEWRYRLIDSLAPGALDGPLRWSPSAHAVLCAGAWDGQMVSLRALPELDDAWLDAVRRVCDRVDISRLRDLLEARAPAPAGGAR